MLLYDGIEMIKTTGQEIKVHGNESEFYREFNCFVKPSTDDDGDL